jgi:hypothetical protein
LVEYFAARRVPPADVRRLLRAIDVDERTRLPISDWRQQLDTARPRNG